MSPTIGDDTSSAVVVPAPSRPRRRGRVALIVAGALLLALAAGALWWFVAREDAEVVGTDRALAHFRSGGNGTTGGQGLPPAGVYKAVASGTESVGLPGMDETFGPEVPVTVVHEEQGCFTYRADLNSHHWRSWTFCPTATARFASSGAGSWTARRAPGLDIESLTTYRCERPLDLLWDDPVAGESRTGSCTGTTDLGDGLTADAGRSEVVGRGPVEVGDDSVEAVHVRTTDTFTGASQGSETCDYWLDESNGLPLRIEDHVDLTGEPSDYSEDISLELSSMTPTT